METENYPTSLQGTEKQTSLVDNLREWEENCKQCNPITPITCLTNCKIWKLKNELRKLYKTIQNPRFMTNLLNALKNNTRLRILEILSKGRYSITKLQQELKKLGYYHSQQTIAEEYITPLVKLGVAEENENRYNITLFGCRLNELMKKFNDVKDILPSHSECYEEIALDILQDKPRTYKDFEGIIPTKSVGRVLNRLQKVGLIETAKENDYVFYFQTKRNLNNTKFSPTERRVYGNIPVEGISARKLAEKTSISLRRTYKYLRKLKGKKLVFTRKRPKSYALIAKGFRTALMLKEIRDLAMEALTTASKIINGKRTYETQTPDTYPTKDDKKKTRVLC